MSIQKVERAGAMRDIRTATAFAAAARAAAVQAVGVEQQLGRSASVLDSVGRPAPSSPYSSPPFSLPAPRLLSTPGFKCSYWVHGRHRCYPAPLSSPPQLPAQVASLAPPCLSQAAAAVAARASAPSLSVCLLLHDGMQPPQLAYRCKNTDWRPWGGWHLHVCRMQGDTGARGARLSPSAGCSQ